MRLVIAEKPSVAKSLAAVLGATTRKDGYLEGNGWLVSWCLGHLAGLADAATYNPDYAKWRYDDLPILPETWRFTIAKDKRDQFDVLRTLLRREDVTEVVNACDAGREGELIFRTVYCLAGCTKPMKRLWISSMEDSAIREGFAQLRPGTDYDGLHQAALCRAKADWLVGINATRLFSVLYHRTLNIGRVMSPTLALIVQREAEIDAFKPVPFYTVALDLLGFTAASARMDKKADAEQLKNACQGGTVTVKQVERRDKSEKPPALYDLTTLQRDANRLLGFTAQQTLDYLQNLYIVLNGLADGTNQALDALSEADDGQAKDSILEAFGKFVDDAGTAALTPQSKLQGHKKNGADDYTGSYEATYSDFAGTEILFGGTTLEREAGSTLHITCSLSLESGKAAVFLRSGADDPTILLSESGEYDGTVEVDGASTYIGVWGDHADGTVSIEIK